MKILNECQFVSWNTKNEKLNTKMKNKNSLFLTTLLFDRITNAEE